MPSDPNDYEIVHLPDPSTIPAPVQPKQTVLAQPPPLSKTTKVNPSDFEIVHLPDNGSSFQAPQVNTDKPQSKPGFGLTPEHSWTPERLQEFLKVLPVLGGVMGGPVGAGAGAFAEQAVSPNPSLTQGAEDTFTQGILPEIVGAAVNPAKNFLGNIASKFINTTNPTVAKTLASKAAEFTSPSSPLLEIGKTLSEPVEGTTIPGAGKFVKGKGLVPEESTTNSILDDYNAGKTPDVVAKKLVSDPREVQKLNLATGTPALTEQLALNHAVSQGYNDVSKTFDPDKILNELGDNKEGYDASLLPGTKNRLTDFLQTAKSLEPTQQTGMMSYLKHRLVFDLGAFGVGHAIAGGGLPGMAVGGTALVLSNQAISRLMSSETLGNLALQSLKLAPDSPVAPIVAKSLVDGLRGTTFFITSDDGKTTQKATVGPDGSIVPVK